MRLVACPRCHLQYDVESLDPAAGDVHCRCGQPLDVRPPKPVDAPVHRCSACGAGVSESASTCDFCGAGIEREVSSRSLLCPECFARNTPAARFCAACGVPFQPVAFPESVAGDPPSCPDCEKGLQASWVGHLMVHECPGCRGLFVPGDHFEALVEQAAERRRHQGRSDPRVEGGRPTRAGVRYRRCPAASCQAFMQRRNFRRSSGIIVDRCGEHGTWLDADELEQIAGFLATGGRPAARAFLEAEEGSSQAAYQRAHRENRARVAGLGDRWAPGGLGGRPSRGGSLLRLLGELLDLT